MDMAQPKQWFAALFGLVVAYPAGAGVVSATPAGFEVRHKVVVAAPTSRVWTTLVAPARWWSGTHSFSGDAGNLTLDPRPGGCFCEMLPGGGVEHLRVVYADAGKQLRLAGALGPLQGEGLAGTLTFTLTPDGDRTAVELRYVVGGYRPGGLDGLAAPVDRVLAEQLGRLAKALGS
jgi:uncharacterized protein YndB with AHSA1/START domain